MGATPTTVVRPQPILPNLITGLANCANAVRNTPGGVSVNATSELVAEINNATGASPYGTGAPKLGGTRRKHRRAKLKSKQRGGNAPPIPQMTVTILQSIFDEVMSTVAPKFTGLNIKEIYPEIQAIVNKLFFKI